MDPETLPRNFGSHQLVGSRVQRRKSSNIDSSVSVAAHELFAFIRSC
jgi:hypothetical protein